MIESRDNGSVRVITIVRPNKANALTAAGKSKLALAISDSVSDRGVAAIVLTGDGDQHFCAGSDVAEMSELDLEATRTMLEAEQAIYRAILGSPKPVVAAVNGWALGTGVILVMVSDYSVGASHAAFGIPEVKFGATTPLEALILPAIVGLGRARALFYMGEPIGADEARTIGLVQEVVPSEDVLARAAAVARRLGEAPAGAFGLQKRWLNRVLLEGDLRAVIRDSLDESASQLADPAVRALAAAHVSRRRC